MKILDRYLLGRFGRMFAGVLAACALLFLLTEVLNNFQDIANNDTPMRQAVLYFLCFLPYRLVQVLPLVSILSVLFSIGILAHNKEMLAITASGLSPARVATPLIAAGVLISIATLAIGELVVPFTESRAQEIRGIYIEGKSEGRQGRLLTKDIFSRGRGGTYYMMRQYDNRAHVMTHPTIIACSDDGRRLLWRMSATTGTLLAEATSQGQTLWRFDGAVQMTFGDKGGLKSMVRHERPLEMPLEPKLHRYLGAKRKPEEMGARELAEYIEMLTAHGESTGRYWTDFWLKIFFPFASLVFIIAGFAFAMRAQVGSIVIGFSQGILYALIFYAALALTRAMGVRSFLPPLPSAIIPLIIFAALSIYYLRRSAYTMT